MKFVLGFLLLAFVASCFARLPSGVTPILSINASYPFNSDLKKFDSLARKADIFAIGEDSHGNAGYQNFQFRLTKYLITRHGYRRVMTEVLSDDRDLNTFLTTGKGNLQSILYYNPWHGSDIEMFNFFSWIRQYNSEHPWDMVTVHAVDPQSPWLDIPIIKAFSEAYDAKYNQTYTASLYPQMFNNCFGATFNNQVEWAYSAEATAYYACGCLPAQKTATCLSAATYFEDLINSEEETLLDVFGETFVGDARYALRSIRSWQTKSATLYTQGFQAARYRETVFGENVLWKAQRNNKRRSGAVLIAHNLHISKQTLLRPFVTAGDTFANIHPVGYIVSKAIGERYVAVAQSGYNVTQMFSTRPYPIPTSPLSIDVTLNALNQPYLLLDTGASWVKKQGVWYVHEEGAPNGRAYAMSLAFDRYVFHSMAPGGKFVSAPTPAVSTRSVESQNEQAELMMLR